jgi:hypothetical protein
VTWWQVLLVFVGIPAAAFFVITLLVMTFARARVPDGLLRAAEVTDGEADDESDGRSDEG